MTQLNRDNRILKWFAGQKMAAVLAVLLVILVPAIAFGIPGSGSFVADESVGGRDITELYNIIAKICLVILLIVEGVLIAAIVKFRRQSEDEQPEPVFGNLKLEVGWTLAALIVQIYIGWITIDAMYEVEPQDDPKADLAVEAIAYQWDWQFRYKTDDGTFMHKDLVVPAHKTVKLEVTSKDVLHSLAIPEMGVKIDAVPGRFNYWWFRADGPKTGLNEKYRTDEKNEPKRVTTREGWWADWAKIWGDLDGADSQDRVTYLGSTDIESTSPYAKYNAVEYEGMCTELCGKGHWDMYFRTVAMTQQSFERWKKDVQSGSGEVDGEKLYSNNCATCHGEEGKGVGESYPTLVDTKWTNNKDNKDKHVRVVLSGLKGEIQVKGKTYDGVMQPWHSRYNDKEVAAIVNHERTSWGNDGGKVDPEFVAKIRKEEGHPPRPGGAGPEPTPTAELLEIGGEVYNSCRGCHGSDGVNGPDMPNLKGNPKVLADPKSLVETLVNGQDTDKWPGRQPPMGQNMTAKEIAGVLTYIRKSWENDASAVQPQEVKEIRRKLKAE